MAAFLDSLDASRALSAPEGQAAPAGPVTCNLDAGWPAPESFPVRELGELAAAVLGDPNALGYTSVRAEATQTVYAAPDFRAREELELGHRGLRREIAGWLRRAQGLAELGPDNVVLTSGSTQALALAGAAFLGPGRGAIVQDPTYPFAPRSFALRGATIGAVPVGRGGTSPRAVEERLEELASRGIAPRLLYVIPTFHLPTGTVMPLDDRERLLELAERWDLVVLEDAVYSDLVYEGTLPPSLLRLDTSGRVLQAHSFSKILASGLRLGWLAGHPRTVRAAAAVREDLGVSQWLARVVEAYVAQGRLDPHIAELRELYRRKRDLAVRVLRERCGDLVAFDVPRGGFYLWVTVDERVDWPRARDRAAAEGVAVREYAAGFRLGFAHLGDEALEQGVATLADAIAASVRSGGAP